MSPPRVGWRWIGSAEGTGVLTAAIVDHETKGALQVHEQIACLLGGTRPDGFMVIPARCTTLVSTSVQNIT